MQLPVYLITYLLLIFPQRLSAYARFIPTGSRLPDAVQFSASWIYVSSLAVSVNPAKTDEPIEMRHRMKTHVSSRNRVLVESEQ